MYMYMYGRLMRGFCIVHIIVGIFPDLYNYGKLCHIIV